MNHPASVEYHHQEIDQALTVLLDLLEIGARFYPPLAIAKPMIVLFLRYEAAKLKGGISDGSIVPDARGGYVPATNSRVHPASGRFIKWTGKKWIYDDFIGGDVEEEFSHP